MTRRRHRRTFVLLLTASLSAGALGVTWSPSASAGVAPTGPAQAPPPGSGVTITVIAPQPLGPLSFT
jgi:hypothetical protein